MDIARIRALLAECFVNREDPRSISAEDDRGEAELAMRALKSLFEREMESLKPSPEKHN